MVKNSPKIEHSPKVSKESGVEKTKDRNARRINKLIEVTPEQKKLIEFLNTK